MLAIDTNVLVYAEGVGDAVRQAAARSLLQKATSDTLAVPVQVLGELFRVLVRKVGLSPQQARERLAYYEGVAQIVPTLASTIADALDLAARHRLQIFDAIILAAAAEAGCRMLLSEDMHGGFVFRGVTVVDPFAADPHPLLADLLRA